MAKKVRWYRQQRWRITCWLVMLAFLIGLIMSGASATPTQPSLYLPENDIFTVDNTPYFEWTAGTGAENHRLLVDNDDDWSSPEIDETFTDENYYFIPTVDSLPTDNYYWKVVSRAAGVDNDSETRTLEVVGMSWVTPSSVESVIGEEAGHENIYSIDDNTSTYWRDDTVDPENKWIIFDMESSRYMEKIRVYQHTSSVNRWGASVGFIVYISDNQDDWGENVWDGKLDASGWQESGEFSKVGRWIRLLSKTSGSTQWILEFDAYVGSSGVVALTNDEAYDVSLEALMNAQLQYDNQDGVRIEFNFQSDYNCYFTDENENWTLADHEYTVPLTDPATEGDWGNRTPVMYVAADDSSAEDKAYVAGLSENGWQCDESDDQIEIQEALENAGNSGKVYLFDGTYIIGSAVSMLSQRSLIGESKDNTVIWNTVTHIPPPAWFGKENVIDSGSMLESVLIENLTLRGGGRLVGGEHLGFDSIHGARNVVIKNVLVMNISCIGIYFELGGSDSYNNWVIDSEVRNTGHGGIIFSAHSGTDHNKYNYIIGNTIANTGLGSPSYPIWAMPGFSGDGGIVLYSPKHCVIANNVIENTGVRGIGVVYGGGSAVHAAENILVQGNYVHRSNMTENFMDNIRIMNDGEHYDNLLLEDINLDAGIVLGGGSGYPSFDVILRGNDVDQFPYAVSINDYCENFILDNNSFYNSAISFGQQGGTGHVIENNVSPVENCTIEKFTSSENHVENVSGLTAASYYIWRPTINYDTTEDNLPWRLFQTSGLGQPQLYTPDNGENIFAGYIHFEWTEGTGSHFSRIVVNRWENFGRSPPNYENYVDLNVLDNFLFTEYLSGGQWYWKVAAVVGYTENWSDTYGFYLYDEVLIETWDTGGLRTEEENAPSPPIGNEGPNAPTSLLTNGQTNPSQLVYCLPWFNAIGTDNDGDQMIYYSMHVDDDSDFSSPVQNWGKESITAFDNGTRCENITYSGEAIVRGVNYFWRIRFWDNNDNAGIYSTETALFRMNLLPDVPMNWTDLGTDVTDFTPTVSWTKGTDGDNDTITTYVYVGTNSTPTTIETATFDNTCELGNTVHLVEGGVYYYRMRNWDGLEWSSYTSADQFIMTGGEEPPSPPVTPPTVTEENGGYLLTLHPIADASVSQSAPTQNYGHQNNLFVQFYIFDADTVYLRWWAYVKYSIPENILNQTEYEIKNIRMSFSVYGVHATPELYVWETTNNWAEDEITWNNKPALGDFVVKMNTSWDENFDNYDRIYVSLDNYPFTGGEVSFVITGNENAPVYNKIYYITMLTKEAGSFGTVEFVYVRLHIIPAPLISLSILCLLMFAGTGLYYKMKEIHNLDTLVDGFELMLILSVVVIAGVFLARSFI